jgi:hypothetical protein
MQLFPEQVLNILSMPEEYLTMRKNDTGTCKEFWTSDKNNIFQGKHSKLATQVLAIGTELIDTCHA